MSISTTNLKETKWRYVLEREPLWKQFIDEKYGKAKGDGTYEVKDDMGLVYGR